MSDVEAQLAQLAATRLRDGPAELDAQLRSARALAESAQRGAGAGHSRRTLTGVRDWCALASAARAAWPRSAV